MVEALCENQKAPTVICRLGRGQSAARPRSSCKFGELDLSVHGSVAANLERGRAALCPLPNLQVRGA